MSPPYCVTYSDIDIEVISILKHLGLVVRAGFRMSSVTNEKKDVERTEPFKIPSALV